MFTLKSKHIIMRDYILSAYVSDHFTILQQREVINHFKKSVQSNLLLSV